MVRWHELQFFEIQNLSKYIWMGLVWLASLGIVNTFNINAQNQAIELGKVQWIRSLQDAQKLAKSSGKPIFILFQEVPGCATCQNYGSEVLSHPLIVEAIESYFVPLAIFNNKGGSDKAVLDIFKEPSWNNPVVRIVSHDLTEWTLRLSSNYSSLGLVEKINATILKTKGKIPDWLMLLEEEFKAYEFGVQKVYLSMSCFWSGEKHYGAIDGVVSTRAGFMDGCEVVEVEYNPNRIKLEKIIESGQENGQANKIFLLPNQKFSSNSIGIKPLSKFKEDQESKYYIFNSFYKFLPMTKLQSARVNAILGKTQNPDHLLSPGQIQILEKIKKYPSHYKHNFIDQDISTAWQKLNP
jgi:hypothetical protein